MEHQQRNRRPSRHAPLGVAHRQHSRERASWRCRQCRCGGNAVAGFCQAECSTGAADAPGRTVCSRRPGRGRCRSRGGRTGGRVKDALFGQICTSHSHFPRSRFLKVQICPNQCTHPAYAPLTPHPQMPNRTKNRQICAPAPSFPSSRHPKTQICRFSVPSPPNSTDGAECARHLMGCS